MIAGPTTAVNRGRDAGSLRAVTIDPPTFQHASIERDRPAIAEASESDRLLGYRAVRSARPLACARQRCPSVGRSVPASRPVVPPPRLLANVPL